jgi:CRP-like cAMP-binding protein
VIVGFHSALSFLSRAAFKTFAKEHPELYEYLVMLLSARLRETDAVIAAGSFLPNKGRLELADEFGQDAGNGRTVIRQKIGQSVALTRSPRNPVGMRRDIRSRHHQSAG